MTSTVLAISNLVVSLGRNPGVMRIIDDVSLELSERETLCLVGESGSGKSVTALTVMGLLLSIAILSVNLIGDAARDALDPRMKQREGVK